MRKFDMIKWRVWTAWQGHHPNHRLGLSCGETLESSLGHIILASHGRSIARVGSSDLVLITALPF